MIHIGTLFFPATISSWNNLPFGIEKVDSRYVNRFVYGPFILRRHFKENLRMTFQTEIDKKFCDTCQI